MLLTQLASWTALEVFCHCWRISHAAALYRFLQNMSPAVRLLFCLMKKTSIVLVITNEAYVTGSSVGTHTVRWQFFYWKSNSQFLALWCIFDGQTTFHLDDCPKPLSFFCKSFLSQMESIVPMISFGDFGTGKFLYERRSRKYRNQKFPMSHERYNYISPWKARRSSEKKISHERRSREWGNFFLLRLLCLEWGNIIVPWMTNREFFPSPFFEMMGLTFLL